MPTKEHKNSQIWFAYETDGLHLIGDLQEVDISGDYEIPENHPFLKPCNLYEMTLEITPPERMTVGNMILGLCGFGVEKLKQNNWRKMHGMVMRRRSGKCKSLKNGKTERQRRNSGRKISV